MSKRSKLAAVAAAAAAMVVVLLAGQALAQTGTPTPAGMMGGNSGMMAQGTVTPMSGMAGMMGQSSTATGTMPGGMMPMQGMGNSQSMGDMAGMMAMMMTMMHNMMSSGGGMMGQGMGSMPGMGSMAGMSGGWSDPNAKPLTLPQAQAAAQKYIQALPNNAGANLAPTDLMEFANGFYVAVGDQTSNSGAMELLVDRYDGSVTPEPGPNMNWNTKYGTMGGQSGSMMGSQASGMTSGQQSTGTVGGQPSMGMMGLWTPPTGTPTITADMARANVQKFIDTKFPGAKLSADLTTFPGYYTFRFEVNGQPAGILSVNVYSGQVWYHTWNGQFLSERSTRATS